MSTDTQAKFSTTTFVTLSNPSGVYGQVSAMYMFGVKQDSVYGQVVAAPMFNVGENTVYGQVIPTPMFSVSPASIYGQVIPTPMFSVSPASVYGQVIPMLMFNVSPGAVYGQVVAISGFDQYTPLLVTNVSGFGDIIYYGDDAKITIESGQFSGDFKNLVNISGLALFEATPSGLNAFLSNSIIFSANAEVAILPDASGARESYFLFSNHNGLTFSVSGVDTIYTSVGANNSVSLSGVGSHLGLICDGNRWIATEENGVIA